MPESIRFGLIGKPLDHSFSARYFNDKFNDLRLPYVYQNFEIDSAEALTELLKDQPQLRGLNVTIPYKSDVIPLLDEVSAESRQIGAVNTIHIHNGKLTGYNTDAPAFRSSLELLLKRHHKKALILGTGGASLAVKHVLQKLGIEYTIVSRQPGSTDILTYAQLNTGVMRDHQVIINTTPLGSFPKINTYPDLPYLQLNDQYLLYDLVYNPEQSVFLKKGAERGCIVKNGQEMLEKQAEFSWQIWNQ